MLIKKKFKQIIKIYNMESPKKQFQFSLKEIANLIANSSEELTVKISIAIMEYPVY